MRQSVRVAILEDHQSIIDGYCFRLAAEPDVEVVAWSMFGEDLLPMLREHDVDVLILDVEVPTSAHNSNPYPILHVIPELLTQYANLHILVISMHNQRSLVQSIVRAGASGYVLKDDQPLIRRLGAAVLSVAEGGVCFSQSIHAMLLRDTDEISLLTDRQREVLSLVAAYPQLTTAEVAEQLDVANSTVRNLLSSAYVRLGVHNRSAAIARARQLGLLLSLSS